MNKNFQELLNNYLNNTGDPYTNLELGQYYDSIGQSAGAMSFYLRAAELTEDTGIMYDCLIRTSLIITKFGRRPHSAKGQLYHAISVDPTRPEAYYHLSRIYEQKQEWLEVYTTAIQSQTFYTPYERKTSIDLDYPGEYAMIFQKAVAAWWINRGPEAKKIFKELLANYEMREDFIAGCISNLNRLKENIYTPLTYTQDLQDRLKVPFKGLEKIQHNLSEAYQDMFVLTMLEGKEQGTYIEIGAADPFKSNNTALLEGVFDWKGISIEYLQEEAEKFNSSRKNKCIQSDARTVDYISVLEQYGRDIDYLQLDCDPPEVTYQILEKIPFDVHRFAVITYEHDAYNGGNAYRTKSRKFLSEKGYVLVGSNIAPDKNRAFEDWWIHPELVSPDVFNSLLSTDNRTKRADLFLQGYYSN